MIPALLLAAALLAPANLTEVFSWTPAPGAVAYRLYACPGPVDDCLTRGDRWVLYAEQTAPKFVAVTADVPVVWVGSNVYPEHEWFRVDVLWVTRPGPREYVR